MPSENTAILRNALRGSGGPETFYDVLHPAIEWDASNAPGAPRVVRGRDAVKAFMPTWRHGWEYWRFEEEDFIDAGESVVTIARGPDPADAARAAVWTFREGKVARFVWYERSAEALAAAGLRER